MVASLSCTDMLLRSSISRNMLRILGIFVRFNKLIVFILQSCTPIFSSSLFFNKIIILVQSQQKETVRLVAQT